MSIEDIYKAACPEWAKALPKWAKDEQPAIANLDSLADKFTDLMKDPKAFFQKFAYLEQAFAESEKNRIIQMDHYVAYCCQLRAEIEALKNPNLSNPGLCPCEACEERRNAR